MSERGGNDNYQYNRLEAHNCIDVVCHFPLKSGKYKCCHQFSGIMLPHFRDVQWSLSVIFVNLDQSFVSLLLCHNKIEVAKIEQ